MHNYDDPKENERRLRVMDLQDRVEFLDGCRADMDSRIEDLQIMVDNLVASVLDLQSQHAEE